MHRKHKTSGRILQFFFQINFKRNFNFVTAQRNHNAHKLNQSRQTNHTTIDISNTHNRNRHSPIEILPINIQPFNCRIPNFEEALFCGRSARHVHVRPGLPSRLRPARGRLRGWLHVRLVLRPWGSALGALGGAPNSYIS